MKWFNDLATMKRLGIGFGAMAVMLALVGGLGLATGASANAAFDASYNHDGRAILQSYAAENALLRIARAYRQAMLVPDPAEKEALVAEVAQRERDAQASIDEAIKGTSTEEARARLAAMKPIVSEYAGIATEAARLSSTDMPKALLAMKASTPPWAKVLAELDLAIKDRSELSRKSFEESEAVYAHDRLMVVLALAFSLALAFAFVVVVGRSVSGPLRSAIDVLARIEKGDLTARLDVSHKDEVGQMGLSLNNAMGSMQSALASVQTISLEVLSAAHELSAAAEEISGGAQREASSLEETAASLEEIGSTVKRNAENAQHASQLAHGARETAERGGKVAESAVGAMAELTRASNKIADIITTIDEIAFQTNLLALNAAVEAARAGEQGRGFGVVASEVRSLSQRTASAAKEIRGLIAETASKVKTGTLQVDESGKALQEIVKSVQTMTDVVSEIAAASREQDAGLGQVTTAVSAMDRITQSNASQTEELSATAQSLKDRAQDLQDAVGAFTIDAGSARNARASAPRHEARGAPAIAAARAARKAERPRVSVRSLPPPANGTATHGAAHFEEF
jgi:methyl-accepting chemotaxis protein